jgi:hypothetical protein
MFHYNGRRLCKNTFNKEWRRGCAVSGIQRHFRELRPAAARNLRIAGYEPNQVIMLTGYTKPVAISYRYEVVSVAESTPTVEARRHKPIAPKRPFQRVKPIVKTFASDEELFDLMADLGVM